MNFKFFLSSELLPRGFTYPDSYIKVVNGILPDITPWRFFSSDLEERYKGLRERYPYRLIVPFAKGIYTDDVACFEANIPSSDPMVINIHDWAGPGYEKRGERKNFSEWLDVVMFLNQTLE